MGLGHGVGLGDQHGGMRPLGQHLGTRVGLGDKWGHGAGTWGGWNETFRVTLGDTGLGHGVGLGDKWGHGAGTWGGFRGQVGTTHSGPFYSEAIHPSDIFMPFLGEYLLI